MERLPRRVVPAWARLLVLDVGVLVVGETRAEFGRGEKGRDAVADSTVLSHGTSRTRTHLFRCTILTAGNTKRPGRR